MLKEQSNENSNNKKDQGEHRIPVIIDGTAYDICSKATTPGEQMYQMITKNKKESTNKENSTARIMILTGEIMQLEGVEKYQIVYKVVGDFTGIRGTQSDIPGISSLRIP